MRVAGVVAEYNPFHNGHALHALRTREATGCDYLVAVMSGAFTQRGEPALLDKWVRARMALLGGIDLVIELPALFCTRTAEKFAGGGVSLLGALGAVTDLSFGCETDDMALLTQMADALEREDEYLSSGIRARLDAGQSHARARGEALCEALGIPPETAAAPNTVLAVEYLRANGRLARPLNPVAIRRDTPYHDSALSPTAPAGAIRAAVRTGDVQSVRQAMPEAAFSLLAGEIPDALSRPEELDTLTLYALRGMTGERLSRLPDLSEGLDRRIQKMAASAATRQELLEKIKCKRYPMARISRALCHALLGMDATLDEQYPVPPYARVLGFRERARPLLRRLNENSAIPVVTDTARLADDGLFALERRATDVWGLTASAPRLRAAGRDRTQRVVIEP